jgi:hypothetical protein
MSDLVFETHEEWKRSKLPLDQIFGPSPGGAAAQLQVSRAVIYTWVNMGFLERIYIGFGNNRSVFISTRSLYLVENIINQLRAEGQSESLQGRRVSKELKERLAQPDIFQTAHLI